MLRSSPLLIAALLATAAPSSGAIAAEQKTSDSDAEAARAHGRRGLSLYNLGKFSAALSELEAAYQLRPLPALLFNIAQCHRQLNDPDKAAQLYRSFLRTDPPAALAKQTRELLEMVEATLQRQRSAAALQPLALHSGLAAPLPAASNAAATKVPAAVLQPSPTAPPRKRIWPALAAGGVAVVAFAGGAIESLASKSATDHLAQLHNQGNVDPSQDLVLRHDASAKFSRGRALYLASAVAAAAGLVLSVAF